MIWNEQAETMPREELETIQLRRLQNTVARVYATVPYYRQKMDQAGVSPGDIRSLTDIKRLPFTTKEDLRQNYPFGLFTVPMERIVRIHASSGTTGKPTVVGYTKRDLGLWAELMSRTLAAAGVSHRDIVQNAYGYGLFTGGLGAHYGAENLGCAVIPISGGNTKRQIQIMQDFGTTVLLSTPSYALNIADTMAAMGVDPADLKLRVGVFGAEPWSEAMRAEIESRLKIKAIDIYGLSEIIGPGVAAECREEQRGLHIMEDHFLPEIVHRDTFEPLPVGEEGELVFTTLTKEAFPVIRYRTKDISRLIPDVCTCGRSFHRMPKVTGRTDDMMIIRGVNVFPSQIEEVIMAIEGVEPHYQIIVTRQGSLDNIEVQVEVSEAIFSDRVKELENLQKKLQGNIKDLLGISCKVSLVEPKSIQRSEGKAQRVIDQRKI
ncbi:phenylacetate--CoA ligase family protein [Desulfurivibrio alkaliphilus]|uniref:Phenylacetate-coenzyme A ligase n=1 Tax=Desulfurivibrio alkaliphilus (strain DSM 19089 / UNIQEM U267 / AHT2) TaxID=589865 RepID=D6Z5T8_DESAT|nr:phenylacetate--CoA ligase [Desulfurivibrio alkaliphilus]ADH84820.1 Phenylacetate--CoA ligase [Desulfurivibrio alkaliphilus AHT 2]